MEIKCLFIHTHPTYGDVIKSQIESLGIKVEWQLTPLLSIESLNAPMPTVILLDYEMVEMDGITYVQQIRARNGGKEPFIIMMTNDTISIEEKTMSDNANIDALLNKPFSLDAFERLLVEKGYLEEYYQ